MGATGKTFKRTTIFIGLGEETSVYESPEAIPEALRKQLMRSTRGMNSATILIADRGGREEIRKMLEGQPNSLDGALRMSYFQKPKAAAGKSGVAASAVSPIAAAGKIAKPSEALALVPGATPESAPVAKASAAWRRAAEYLLPAALGMALWFLFTLR